MIQLENVAAAYFYYRCYLRCRELSLVASCDELFYKGIAVVREEDVPYGFGHSAEIPADDIVVVASDVFKMLRYIQTSVRSLTAEYGAA